MALVLYGTQACHLCELAQQVIVEVAGELQCDVFVEDISESEALFERFGERIPVLLDEHTQAELDWPFDSSALLQWYRALRKDIDPS